MNPILANALPSWWDIYWLTPATLSSFDWENPFFLKLLIVPPLVLFVRWLLNARVMQKLDIALIQDKVKTSPIAYLRFIPSLLKIAAISFVLVALARPQKTTEAVEQWTEGIDIMLVTDISESMKAEDFSPNRLEAAKRVGRNFIEGRFQDRIGMVIFAGEAVSYAPLTTDYKLLNTLVDQIDFSMMGAGGTAIGSAIAIGISRMTESDTKSKVMILLSDGDNTAGSLDPIAAAKLAYAEDIKIYTIGVGKEGKVPFGKDVFGRTRYVENSLDETTLREIAKTTGGKFFRATNDNALEEVFNIIDQFEKAEIKETRFRDTQDFYKVYLTMALLFLALWVFSKTTFVSNILED